MEVLNSVDWRLDLQIKVPQGAAGAAGAEVGR